MFINQPPCTFCPSESGFYSPSRFDTPPATVTCDPGFVLADFQVAFDSLALGGFRRCVVGGEK